MLFLPHFAATCSGLMLCCRRQTFVLSTRIASSNFSHFVNLLMDCYYSYYSLEQTLDLLLCFLYELIKNFHLVMVEVQRIQKDDYV